MMKINESNFCENDYNSLGGEIHCKIVAEISSLNSIQRENIESSLKRINNQNASISDIVKDIIFYHSNDERHKTEYHIEEYIRISKYYKKTEYLFKSGTHKDRKDYLIKLIKFLEQDNDSILNIREYLVTNSDSELEKNQIVSQKKFKEFINDIVFKNLHTINESISSIFDYDKHIKVLRNRILKAMNLSICPYCNKEDFDYDLSKSTTDIDHFYSQSDFPLLALTLSNFVPSCLNCNRSFKGSSMDEILNPRLNGFDSVARLTSNIPGNESLFRFHSNVEQIKLDFRVNCEDQIFPQVNTSLKLFDLEKRYNHKSVKTQVYQTYKLLNKYRKSYREAIGKIVNEEILASDQISDQLGFDINEDLINIKYGKLTLDLLYEMQILP